MSTSIIHGDAQGRGAGVGESLFLITLHWPLWCKTLFKRNINISCRLDHVVLLIVWFHIPNAVLIAVAFLGRFPVKKRICVSMGFLNQKKLLGGIDRFPFGDQTRFKHSDSDSEGMRVLVCGIQTCDYKPILNQLQTTSPHVHVCLIQ